MERKGTRFFGVDLAKKSMEVCVLEDGREAIRSTYRTDSPGRTRLYSTLASTDVVAIEACALAFVLARELKREVGCTVHVLNPGKLAIIYQSTRKTDKEDAYKLASLVMRYEETELPIVAVPDEEEEMMRSLVSMKQYIVRLRTSMLNRLHTVYVQAGLTFVKKSDLGTSPSRERTAIALTGFLANYAAMLEKELVVAEAQIAELESEIGRKVAAHELAPFIISLPGVGP